MTTGSAYSAWDAVGAPFPVAYAAGNPGALVSQMNVLDLGTSNAAMLVHFYSRQPVSAAADGDTWTLNLADFSCYCGAIPVSATNWVTAGTARNKATIITPNIGIEASAGSRTVWAQMQAPAVFTANGTANPFFISLGTLQD